MADLDDLVPKVHVLHRPAAALLSPGGAQTEFLRNPVGEAIPMRLTLVGDEPVDVRVRKGSLVELVGEAPERWNASDLLHQLPGRCGGAVGSVHDLHGHEAEGSRRGRRRWQCTRDRLQGLLQRQSLFDDVRVLIQSPARLLRRAVLFGLGGGSAQEHAADGARDILLALRNRMWSHEFTGAAALHLWWTRSRRLLLAGR
mmetsp:Transcript_75464/g.179255  ORF Transcript_75464/g.179255 Transcript_75464/m.179255 type:complete len:200 (+) Transcript_75464:998-1597(+)